MAQMNFVAGGYFGKLGGTVGQRWRNKRIVRTWVKGSNPRTPAQMQQRGIFGRSVSAAQLAIEMNYKAPCFSKSDAQEWAERMAAAVELDKNNASVLNRIPVCPVSYAVKYALSGVRLENILSADVARFSVTGALPPNPRRISVAFAFWDSQTESYTIEVVQTTLVDGSKSTFTVEGIVSTLYDANTKVLLVSRDDRVNNNEMVLLAEASLNVGDLPHVDFNFNDFSISRNDNAFTIVFKQVYETFEGNAPSFVLSGVSNGLLRNITFNSTEWVNAGGYFGLKGVQTVAGASEIVALPVGSTVNISGFSLTCSDKILDGVASSFSFSNDDLERSFDTSGVITSTASKEFELSTAQGAPAGYGVAPIALQVKDMFAGALQFRDVEGRAFSSGGVMHIEIEDDFNEGISFEQSELKIQNVIAPINGVNYKIDSYSKNFENELFESVLPKSLFESTPFYESGEEYIAFDLTSILGVLAPADYDQDLEGYECSVRIGGVTGQSSNFFVSSVYESGKTFLLVDFGETGLTWDSGSIELTIRRQDGADGLNREGIALSTKHWLIPTFTASFAYK